MSYFDWDCIYCQIFKALFNACVTIMWRWKYPDSPSVFFFLVCSFPDLRLLFFFFPALILYLCLRGSLQHLPCLPWTSFMSLTLNLCFSFFSSRGGESFVLLLRLPQLRDELGDNQGLQWRVWIREAGTCVQGLCGVVAFWGFCCCYCSRVQRFLLFFFFFFFFKGP